MRVKILFFYTLFVISAICIVCNVPVEEIKEDPAYPNDWILAQRSYPNTSIDYAVYNKIRKEALHFKQHSDKSASQSWELVGPKNVGGRVTDVEMHPSDTNIVYVGTASGGVFKVENNGHQVTSIFDDAYSLSIGDLVIDPNDKNTIYVGTGEANASAQGGAFPGYGIYKSADAGSSWTHLGLEETFQIGRIVVDPNNSNRVFAAAMGVQYGLNSDRGVYRSEDGGQSWNKVLYLNDTTGCIDIAIHPENPDTVYAAMWSRIRYANGRRYAGEGSGLYRSYDGGDNWDKLSGLPTDTTIEIGRIGIVIAESNPNTVYTCFTEGELLNSFAGLYRSDDNGDNWTRKDTGDMSYTFGSFGWFFSNVRVAPDNPDDVYLLGLMCKASHDGGVSWDTIINGDQHVDQHGFYQHPMNPNKIVAGNDGGLFYSFDKGQSWTHCDSLPISQLYTCTTDPQNPNNYYGGLQDNGTQRTLTGKANDWDKILWGDGFYVIVDPLDDQVIYAEYQWGNIHKTTNGGPNMDRHTSGIKNSDRKNWNVPLVMDPNDNQILYTGTHRVYKSDNAALNWQSISQDLTDGPSTGNLGYGTITTIDVAPTNSDYIYVGTVDGNVWVTKNGGLGWTNISNGTPKLWVTRVSVDPLDENICYVTFSGYESEDYTPHIFKTMNAGSSFTNISGDLPSFPINDVVLDENNSNLYIATDYGVFYSNNDGTNWASLGTDFPNVPVFDLHLDKNSKELVAATFGRSMYAFDLNLFSSITEQGNDFNVQLFPNPANDFVNISFELKKPETISITLFDIQGKEVMTLAPKHYAIGKQQISLNTKDLKTGTYFCRVEEQVVSFVVQ